MCIFTAVLLLVTLLIVFVVFLYTCMHGDGGNKLEHGGGGEARVRGLRRVGGDRGGVPLGFFLQYGASGPVSLLWAELWGSIG